MPPRLAISTHGAITAKHHPGRPKTSRWEAYCTYRDLDGVARKVTRWGASKTAATARLVAAIRDRHQPSRTDDLSPQSPVAEVAQRWCTRIETRRSPNTVRTYRGILDKHVIPALGQLRLIEISPGYLDDYLDSLETHRKLSAEYRRTIRTVLSGIFGMAVRAGALADNPVRNMSRIEGTPRKARALTADERRDLLAKLDDLRCGHHLAAPAEKAASCKMCAAARGDLPALVMFMLGTGCRIGEALAVRWCDLDLDGIDVAVDGTPVRVRTVALGPTIVRVPGRGLVRQEAGKTSAAKRTIPLPGFLVTMLSVRRPVGAHERDAVFPSTALTWRDPSGAARMWRKVRERVGYPWVTSHVFRKTAITILDGEKLTARQIADVVGHARPSLTQDVYMHRGEVSPLVAGALDAAFRGDQAV